MATIKSFTDLEIWKLSVDLYITINKEIKNFPIEEKFGITDQLRRSTLSVSTNIAEGFGRYHTKDCIKFYYNARGSLFEAKSLIIVAQKSNLIDNKSAMNLVSTCDTIGIKLNNFIKIQNNFIKG